ncbi:MAG: proline dehydrogenase family protein [Actinomycetota bacterium]|nr:proline dehydrogenase family protein [Actinomycetota bacterium]
MMAGHAAVHRAKGSHSVVINRTLLWAAEKDWVKNVVTRGKLGRSVVNRFVAGDDLESAVQVIKELNSRKIGGILDLLGEGVTTAEGAEAAAGDYLAAIKRIEETQIDTTISVKLTQLGLGFDKGAAIDYLRRLGAEAQVVGTGVEVDMEQSEYVSDTLDVFRVLQQDFPEMRLAIQAYLRRTAADLQLMANIRPRIRLVKGAYAESEAVAFQKKKELDGQYAFLTDWLFEQGTDPAIATHDGRLIEHAKTAAARTGAGKRGFEIQMLYGIRRDLQEELAGEGFRVRVYVPYGEAWYPYLVRRLAERPSNVRFFLRAVAGR